MEMKNAQRGFTVLCLLISIQVTDGVLTEQPGNTVATLNENATIKCLSNESVQWQSFKSDTDRQWLWYGEQLIKVGCHGSFCHVVKEEPEKYNLIITARKANAMNYECTEKGSTDGVSATLIVIDSNMTCTTNTTTNTTTSIEAAIVCSIKVYGLWKPRIKWSVSDNEASVIPGSDTVTQNDTVTLRVPLKYDGAIYTVSVYFDGADRPAAVTATNVPGYTGTWTFTSPKSEDKSDSVPAWKIVVPVCVCAGAACTIGGVAYKRHKGRTANGSMDTSEQKHLQRKDQPV